MATNKEKSQGQKEIIFTKNNIGRMYIDNNNALRMVMDNRPNNFVRGINVLNMNISGIIINSDLSSVFSGHGYFNGRINKVTWVD